MSIMTKVRVTIFFTTVVEERGSWPWCPFSNEPPKPTCESECGLGFVSMGYTEHSLGMREADIRTLFTFINLYL